MYASSRFVKSLPPLPSFPKPPELTHNSNPWGERDSYGLGEWTGPWSDGSKEWTPYWLSKLSHTFGDDGVFWMSFSDMLSTFKWVHRTRLFDSRWTVVSAWTSASISWVSGFLRKKFRVEVGKAGTVVVVLSQLDDRYFAGLEGQYYFELQFVLQRDGGEHVCGARQVHKWENRSISCEVDLEVGVYEVVPKITASRRYGVSVGEMVQKHAEDNPQKVRQVGMQYDLAHAKPGVSDFDQELEKAKEKKKKKEEDKKKKEKAKEKQKKEKEKKAARKEKERLKKQKVRERKRKERAKKAAEKEAEEKKKRNEDRQKRRDAKAEEEAGNKEEDTETKAPETEVKASDSTLGAEGTVPKTDLPTPGPESSTEKETNQAEDGATPNTPLSEVSKSELPAENPEAPEKPAATEAQAVPVEPDYISSDEEIFSIVSLSDIETDDSPESSDAESDSDSESDAEQGPVPPPPPPVDPPLPNHKTRKNPPWNPVCVLGLRVYALDPHVSVKLVEVEDKKDEGNDEKKDGEAIGDCKDD